MTYGTKNNLKCITQLFGEQMMVANATGCSSIYGGSAPATPYCRNYRSGFGPAWANSLFEDNAEFGLGMATATRQMRDRVERIMKEGLQCDCCSAEIKALFTEWIENRENTLKTKEIADKLIPLMEACGCDICKQLLELRHSLVKKSQWIFGGDGWGYDIGFGGLDHVLASGEDVNVVVVDTEVYSNTGGQSSKATPAGAVAKFATSGKKIRKKDLGMIAKSYGYVYVAQVAMGASQAQYFNVIKEAEAYHGPSLIICYAPCINHGIKIGMGRTQNEEKKAVECGYSLFSASLSKSHWLFFTSGTSTPPKRMLARMASTSTRRSPTGASSATWLRLRCYISAMLKQAWHCAQLPQLPLWARCATTR